MVPLFAPGPLAREDYAIWLQQRRHPALSVPDHSARLPGVCMRSALSIPLLCTSLPCWSWWVWGWGGGPVTCAMPQRGRPSGGRRWRGRARWSAEGADEEGRRSRDLDQYTTQSDDGPLRAAILLAFPLLPVHLPLLKLICAFFFLCYYFY